MKNLTEGQKQLFRTLIAALFTWRASVPKAQFIEKLQQKGLLDPYELTRELVEYGLYSTEALLDILLEEGLITPRDIELEFAKVVQEFNEIHEKEKRSLH